MFVVNKVLFLSDSFAKDQRSLTCFKQQQSFVCNHRNVFFKKHVTMIEQQFIDTMHNFHVFIPIKSIFMSDNAYKLNYIVSQKMSELNLLFYYFIEKLYWLSIDIDIRVWLVLLNSIFTIYSLFTVKSVFKGNQLKEQNLFFIFIKSNEKIFQELFRYIFIIYFFVLFFIKNSQKKIFFFFLVLYEFHIFFFKNMLSFLYSSFETDPFTTVCLSKKNTINGVYFLNNIKPLFKISQSKIFLKDIHYLYKYITEHKIAACPMLYDCKYFLLMRSFSIMLVFFWKFIRFFDSVFDFFVGFFTEMNVTHSELDFNYYQPNNSFYNIFISILFLFKKFIDHLRKILNIVWFVDNNNLLNNINQENILFNKLLLSNIYANTNTHLEFSKFFYEISAYSPKDNEWLEISDRSFYVKVFSVNASFYNNINLNSMLCFFEKDHFLNIESNYRLCIDAMISLFLFEFFFENYVDSNPRGDSVVDSDITEALDILYGCIFY